MAVYFVRRLLGGAITWIAAAFVLFTLLMYIPGGVASRVEHELGRHDRTGRVLHVIRTYELDKSWPFNYLAWMFDPADTERLDDATLYLVPEGVDLSVLGLSIKGSGVLTGDFGSSLRVTPYTPVLQVYGLHFGVLLAITLEPALLLVLIAFLQRMGRKPLRSLSIAHARWLYAVQPIHVQA
jgi:ABC-type dipeptide/oligopeptide/nickel transport system permease component